jgi:U3 small nucleolar RNA-associated protein 10
MATNLARQLQRLEVPGQPSLQQLASKKRPSFLFDAREAGDVDTETVFHLATNGLEELATIDETFLEFRDTLFSDTYKEFERTHTTDEEVESLNRELERFLLLVSPYFLLKPSHKCLEWLVRVFRINSFNVDHVMQCILPYYQTNLFVRMVQLLPLKSHTSRWHWLRPLQKSGSPLSQQTLINHCIADHASLVFICELVGKWVRCQKHRPNCSQTAIALYTTTLVGVIEMTKKISEDLVTLISPYLTKGLKSKNCDLYCSSLVSVSLLSSKVLLVDRLVHSFIETIAKNLKPEFEQESFLCLSYVCSSQKQRILTRKTTSHLLKYDRTVVCLESMLKSQNIIHFCELLMRSVVDVLSGDSPNDIYFRVLVDMARDFPISDVFVEELTKYILNSVLQSVHNLIS